MAFTLTLRMAQTPRAAWVRRFLQAHGSRFEATGEALYICHREEIGNTDEFLTCVLSLVGASVQATWAVVPWPWQDPSNVLVVRHRHAEGLLPQKGR